jgi:hypothetical protein
MLKIKENRSVARQALSASASLSKDEARRFAAEAATKIGSEAISAVVLPTLERIMAGDLEVVDFKAVHEVGMIKAVRAKSLLTRLKDLCLDDDQMAAAINVSRLVERARIGRLTACYDGAGGGAAHEPERFLVAVDELSKAMAKLDSHERAIVWGLTAFDVSLADLGGIVAGSLTKDRNAKIILTKYILIKALNKLSLFFLDQAWRAEEAAKWA